MGEISNKYDKQIDDINEENIRLNVKLNNSMQEMNESKTDFDEIVRRNEELKENNKNLINDVETLKYVINETNQRSLKLIECVNSSHQIISNLSYNNSDSDDISSSDVGSCVVGNNNYV